MTRWWSLAACLLLTSCADPIQEPTELDVSCTGKCDGVGSIRSLYRDIREGDLTGLAARGTTLATDELNDALSTSFVGVELLDPVIVGSSTLAAEEEHVDDLDALSAGLLAQFGEGELSADVNAVRLRQIESGEAEVFVESGFRVSGGLDHGFRIESDGILDGSSVQLGLGSGELEGRVVTAADLDPGTAPEAILEGVRSSRDFVVPRSLDDVRAMRPGEAVALRADGSFGLNVGVGVPIAIADPGAITYSLVVSAALRAYIEGAIDVQLVRLEGDEVVVDVGTDDSRGFAARLAVEDGWGASGLIETDVEIGDRVVPLDDIVSSALQRRMSERLNLVSAELSRTGQASRLSVMRLRFDLSAGSEGLEDALTQALRGDVRLAQALAAMDDDGVRVEYDLLRTGLSATSTARLDLFGFRFFRTMSSSSGELLINTPGGAQSLMFDTVRRERGAWFSSYGNGRTILGGIRRDRATGRTQTDANLFVQVLEGDRYLERDKLVDHLDALILAVAGADALAAFEAPANELLRFVESTCNPSPAFDPCRENVLMDPEVLRLRADARAALEAATTELSEPLQQVVYTAGDLRIASSATVEPAASFVGPTTSVVLDYRLDDASLEAMLVEGRGQELRASLVDVLVAALRDREVEPSGDPADLLAERMAIEAEHRATLDAMQARFDAGADEYERRLASERAVINGIGPVGATAIGVRFEIGEDGEPATNLAEAQTLVRERAWVARDLFDALLEEAFELDREEPDFALGYALLRMQQSRSSDVRMEIVMPLDDRFSQDFDHYRAAGQMGFTVHGRGSDARLIGGGVFDVDALINLRPNR